MKSFNPFGWGRHRLSNVGWSTYFTLRSTLMTLAVALPLMLAVGGAVFGSLSLQTSVSAYYHAGHGALRDIFVGSLAAVAMLLFVYKGFSDFENWALNLAAAALTVVALVPDNRSTALSAALPWLHGAAAIAFFTCLVYVAYFRSADTLSLLPDSDRTRLRRFYKTLGGLMAGLVVGAAMLAWVARPGSFVFFVEAGAVWAFAAYWYFKTVEMRESGADALAGRRLLTSATGYSWRDIFRELPVTRIEPGVGA
jgi:hypothetical protein